MFLFREIKLLYGIKLWRHQITIKRSYNDWRLVFPILSLLGSKLLAGATYMGRQFKLERLRARYVFYAIEFQPIFRKRIT